ncbi:hypothetical protein ACSBOX_11470 [Arthrobacter sp. KN11-1C]|uniref:hypothetical protein n=1 Tax=Arthrobacter sp. KN11-1C TaxID=3445774 RepID=UPI003FA18CB8
MHSELRMDEVVVMLASDDSDYVVAPLVGSRQLPLGCDHAFVVVNLQGTHLAVERWRGDSDNPALSPVLSLAEGVWPDRAREAGSPG